MKRTTERGSAMLVTMIIVAALLAGGAVLASMQASSSRSSELTRNGLAALYCAESGLTVSRAQVAANYGDWNNVLAANCADDGDCNTFSAEPAWMSTVNHSIDGDTTPDFVVSIRDNDDETGTQDRAVDIDDRVFVVVRCTKYADTPRRVEELILYKPAMNCYRDMEGGCNDSLNTNNQ